MDLSKVYSSLQQKQIDEKNKREQSLKTCEEYGDFVVNMVKTMAQKGELTRTERYVNNGDIHRINCADIVAKKIENQLGIKPRVYDNGSWFWWGKTTVQFDTLWDKKDFSLSNLYMYVNIE